MLFIVGLVLALFTILITHLIYRWRNPICRGGILPPGSMGLPILGESIEYFKPYYKDDIPPFIRKRMSRYGSVFRTSIVGQQVVVSTDSEINSHVFQREDDCFQCWYTESFFRIIGDQSLLSYHGGAHKYLKNLMLNLLGPEKLKAKLLLEMNRVTQEQLHSWTNPGILDAKEANADMVFMLGARMLLSFSDKEAVKKLRENYTAFMTGLISFPLNIPGTAYHACLQGRKSAIKVIQQAFKERRSSSKGDYDDFLGCLIKEIDKEDTFLTEGIAEELILLLLFAAYETTSTAMTLAMKFLNDHPAVFAELTKEHEKIIQNRDVKDSPVTWAEYKSMNYTHMVINETVRLANIVPGIFRKVIKDVEIKGFTIPKGWTLMVCPASVHLNPDKYDDPLSFNPRRWETRELHVATKTFMAFGGGVRLCVGADFAKLQMAIFLHYLVTNYRWTVVEGGNTVRKPGLLFPNGLHIQISAMEK